MKLSAFRRWLSEQFDTLESCTRADPDFFAELDIAEMVETASRTACRLGAGHLVEAERPNLTAREALPVIGRLLAWAEKPSESDLISVVEVAAKLGTSTRTIWRMVPTGEMPSPVKFGGLTRWRRGDIQAMIDLLPNERA